MVAAVSFGGTLGLLILAEVVKIHDLITGGGPAAELRRYRATNHPSTTHTRRNRHGKRNQ